MRMNLAATILLAASMTGHAAVINTNDWVEQTSYPTRIGGNHNPTIEDRRAAGWREFGGKCPAVAGSNVVSWTRNDDGITATCTDCQYEAIPYRPAYAGYSLDSIAPLLGGFPSTNDIPDGGMFFRLRNEVDSTIIELWHVRGDDYIATQISAHNHLGEMIDRSVNLITGLDEVINKTRQSNARNFNDLNGARTIKTNQSIRARSNR